MSEFVDRDLPSSSPFIGLRPSRSFAGSPTGSARHRALREPGHPGKTLFATMPVLLVGSLAISSLGLVPLPDQAKSDHRHRVDAADPEAAATIDSVQNDSVHISSAETSGAVTEGQLDVAAITPASYTVRAGDTVSTIAGRYRLATAAVLALNGLGWKSLIFPGQVLRLTKATGSAPVLASHVTTPAPITAPAPTTAPAPGATSGAYVIQRGDTLTSISKKLGVSIAALLAANHLTASSIIYAGRTLVVPGLALAQVGSVTVPLSPTMRANAQTVVSVGRSLGVPDYGIIVALSAAAQESGLLNLTYGDRDSVGLFQQRPSAGWGTVAQLTTPAYAARLFYGGPSNPNKSRTRGLLDIAGWQSMTVTQAAQAVQISGSPNAYAKWETSARFWLAQFG